MEILGRRLLKNLAWNLKTQGMENSHYLSLIGELLEGWSGVFRHK